MCFLFKMVKYIKTLFGIHTYTLQFLCKTLTFINKLTFHKKYSNFRDNDNIMYEVYKNDLGRFSVIAIIIDI